MQLIKPSCICKFLLLKSSLLDLDCNFFLLNCFGEFVASDLVPHLLEIGVFFDFFPIVRPVEFVLVLRISQDSPPILVLEMVLNLPDILVRIIEDVDGLDSRECTSLLSWLISTSLSFSLTSLRRVSPCSTMLRRSFLALRRGISSFLFLVC
jgi:hypothetical protein